MNLSQLLGFFFICVILALICQAEGTPKQYDSSSDNSSNNSWRRRSSNETETAASDRTQRLGNLGLGTTGYGNSLGGYGSYGGIGSAYGKVC
jgi:hypothetical protein